MMPASTSWSHGKHDGSGTGPPVALAGYYDAWRGKLL